MLSLSSGTLALLTAALLAAPALAAEVPAAPALSLTGFTRVRAASYQNFDLNAATVRDGNVFLSELRSFLTLEAKWEGLRLVSSVDLAGTDFDKGAQLGFDNPARQRPFELLTRQLYLDYAGPWGLQAVLGRQPARLGYGFVSAINRDAFKLIAHLPDEGPMTAVTLTASAVRGAKGVSQWSDSVPAPSAGTVVKGQGAATTILNDPNGAAHDLSTYVVAYNATPVPQGRFQAFVVQQIDSSQDGMYPSKRYFDVNGEVPVGPVRLGAEAIALGGLSPMIGSGRHTLDSFALYGTARYPMAPFDLAFSLGRGGGDVDAGDGVENGFASLFIDDSSFAVNPLFGDELYGYDGTDASIGRGAGMNNVTFLQPSVTWQVAPGLAATAAYTLHLASAPQRAGAGPLGQTPTAATALASRIGDELDARLAYTAGVATFYGLASTFVPGDVYANPGLANAATKLEVGTEVKF